MSHKYHVSAVCNALVDIIIDGKDQDLQKFDLSKGIMHLVDQDRQKQILDYFKGHEQTVELGGSAMNAIRAISALGLKTLFVGMVGDDEFGNKMKGRMKDLGIEARLGTGTEPSGSCVIIVTPDGERTMNTHLGASRLYAKEHIPVDDLTNCDIFHFCGYQWDTAEQKEAIHTAIATAKQHNSRVSFDVADPFVVQNNAEDFKTVIEEQADIVFANQSEAELLYGKTAEYAGEAIAATGAIAAIKLGAEGAKIYKGSEVVKVDPVATNVIDTTAAGDMFAGGFLFGLAQGSDLHIAGKCAATLASDVISRHGATLSDQAITKVAGFIN